MRKTIEENKASKSATAAEIYFLARQKKLPQCGSCLFMHNRMSLVGHCCTMIWFYIKGFTHRLFVQIVSIYFVYLVRTGKTRRLHCNVAPESEVKRKEGL